MVQNEDVIPLSAANSEVPLLIALLKLSSIIGRPMKEEVADRHDLSTNELRVMMCLGGEGPMAGQEIATVMAMMPMNVSRALAALEARGWTERVSNRGNRRRRPVQLSAAGWQAYGAMLPDVREVARRLFATHSREERRVLAVFFDRLIGAVEAWDVENAAAGERSRAAD